MPHRTYLWRMVKIRNNINRQAHYSGPSILKHTEGKKLKGIRNVQGCLKKGLYYSPYCNNLTLFLSMMFYQNLFQNLIFCHTCSFKKLIIQRRNLIMKTFYQLNYLYIFLHICSKFYK